MRLLLALKRLLGVLKGLEGGLNMAVVIIVIIVAGALFCLLCAKIIDWIYK
jgi:hypothetical protein